MREHFRILKRFIVPAFVLFGMILIMAVPDSAGARMRRGGVAIVVPPPVSTCPNGLAYVSFDGCDKANLNAQFVDPNLVSTYALDSTGNPQTIYHIGPFNKAGIDFPVGQTSTTGKVDPRTISVIGQATTQANSVTFLTITNGGTPQVGMTIWDRPAGATVWYPNQSAPKISAPCTGSLPSGIVCPIDRTVTTRSSAFVYASLAPGCVTLIQGGGTNGSSGASYDQINCDYRGSAVGFTSLLTNITTAPVNGHNATILTTTGNSSSAGAVELTNAYLTNDSNTSGINIVAAGISVPNIRLTIKDSECDGGLAGDPLLGPWSLPGFNACVNWASPGTSGNNNQVLMQNLYIHDFKANPLSLSAGYTDVYEQNLLFNRIGMACTPTGCHAATTQYSTSVRGGSGSVKMYNITAVFPYGFARAAVTGAMPVLGGLSTAIVLDVDIKGATILANTSNAPGTATMSIIATTFRVGKVSNLQLQHIYNNGPGTYQCFGVGGDLQSNGQATGALVANPGTGYSTMTWSGFQLSSQSSLPYPGQFIYPDGVKVEFTGTLADRGDGKSNLTITNGIPGFTIPAGNQIAALDIIDPQAHPTLIVSGSGANYIVDNKSGSGENRASQIITVASVLMPFGTIDPATGLPSTAVGGSTLAGYNGTWVVGGEKTYTTKTWAAAAPQIGNLATLSSDIIENWSMGVAGSGGAIGYGGIDLTSGSCPGSQPP